MDGRSERKIKKIAKKGSKISALNLKEAQASTTDYDSLLKKLELSREDLIMNSSKRIGDSKIKLSIINKIQVFDYNNLYIIKVPEQFLKNPSFSEEKSNFIKTNKGLYLLYDSN
jgi:nitrate reductase alpha subunit